MSNKLGLQMRRTLQGDRLQFGFNEEPAWTKKVWDIRNYDFLNNIKPGTASYGIMLTEVETGHLITILRVINGRIGDGLTAWIHVPGTVDIAGKELDNIIKIVKNEQSAPEANQSLLNELFSKSFDTASAKKVCSASTSSQVAIRYYGKGTMNTLAEILDAPCQSYYRDYKTVLLFEKESNATSVGATDLTMRDIERMVVVPQPIAADGWAAFIGNEPFNQPIYKRVGETLAFEWRRKGYAPIAKSVVVKDNLHLESPTQSEYRILFSYNNIRVVDEKNVPVKDYTLKIENKLVSPGRDIDISEEQVSRAKVVVTADYHEPFENICDLRPFLEKPGRITLKAEPLSYKFKIHNKSNGKYITYECRPSEKFYECPIEGYELEMGDRPTPNKESFLRYAGGSKAGKMAIVLFAVLGLVLGGAIAWCSTWMYYKGVVATKNGKITILENEKKELKKELGVKEHNKPSKKKEKKEDAVTEDSKEPKADKPKADKPKADKPKADKPKADKPKVDKPKVDKPKEQKKPIIKSEVASQLDL